MRVFVYMLMVFDLFFIFFILDYWEFFFVVYVGCVFKLCIVVYGVWVFFILNFGEEGLLSKL